MIPGHARNLFFACVAVVATGVRVMALAGDPAPRVAFRGLFATLLTLPVIAGAAFLVVLARVRRGAARVDKALSGRIARDHIARFGRRPG